jgi:ketosteroid isomerase-like protein
MTTSRTVACLVLLLGLAGSVRAQDQEAAHQELRALRDACVAALNSRSFDAIPPLLAQEFTIVTVDNQKFTKLDDFRGYFEGLFTGPNAMLEKVEVQAETDELTRFLGSGDTGIAFGTTNDTYHFKDGDVRSMKTRWSAVVKKEDARWKLASVHFSTGLLDNPVVDAAASFARTGILAAGIGGLLAGAGLGALLARRRRAA